MSRIIISPERRFWPKVKMVDLLGCWEWQGAKDKMGYGFFWDGYRITSAHRFAYNLSKGLIAEGLTIDHLCRNHSCVNPNHLEAVTLRVNILRGIGLAAINSVKTICSNGHPLTTDNIYFDKKRGKRSCRLCKLERCKNYYRENKTERK